MPTKLGARRLERDGVGLGIQDREIGGFDDGDGAAHEEVKAREAKKSRAASG